ncbi:MAG TPA: hypothetical protein VGN12_19570 [Pirellulales bacterium]|jgi:hypothetical protein
MTQHPDSKRPVVGTPMTRGIAQLFGLHPRAAVLLMLIDVLLFGGETISLGLLLPLSVAVAGVLGLITYRIQRRDYGDDHDAALTKALVLGLLTAIPGPLSPVLALPCGALGLARTLLRK